MKLKTLGLAFLVLGLTLTTTACSSEKTANSSTEVDNPPAITSPQPSNENTPATPSPTTKPSTSSPVSPSPTTKPSTSAPETTSPAVKASSRITSGEQAGALVKKTIFNNSDGIAMSYYEVESYNGFQCYHVKASSKSMQANGGSGTIGFYDVEIESGRIWDLATNKIAIPN